MWSLLGSITGAGAMNTSAYKDPESGSPAAGEGLWCRARRVRMCTCERAGESFENVDEMVHQRSGVGRDGSVVTM